MIPALYSAACWAIYLAFLWNAPPDVIRAVCAITGVLFLAAVALLWFATDRAPLARDDQQ